MKTTGQSLWNFAHVLLGIFCAFTLSTLSGCSSSASGVLTFGLRSEVDIGLVALSTPSLPRKIIFTNTTALPLSFSSIPTISGTHASNFSISSNSCIPASPLSAGGTCTISITFTPSSLGVKTASLSFSHNGTNSPVWTSLKGTGIEPVVNELPAQVAPEASSNTNILYVNVTICSPGTNTCQTIPNVSVDTGSTGLRLLSSAVTIALPQMLDGSDSPFANCVQFADLSYGWGPLATADIKLSGEVAFAQPIQLMHKQGFAPAPSGCVVSGGEELTNLESLGGNGILGMGLLKHDCGQLCADVAATPAYYSCSGGTCTPTTMPLAQQLQNPVDNFDQDNNGFVIELPAISAAGAPTVNGLIKFGIETKANNEIGSATVFTTNLSGRMTTTYNGNSYPSFIDSGSNGLFFLTDTLSGLPECSFPGFYCPATTTQVPLINQGTNASSDSFSLSIANAQTLFNTNFDYVSFNNLGGPFPGAFDFGLPFFFGKRIFFGIEGKVSSGEMGPFFAY